MTSESLQSLDFPFRKGPIAFALILLTAFLAGTTWGEEEGAEERSPNQLIKENSPYLLQHAYNPVDWYPWGDEAFALARVTGKPIFLSVGYSTCHWCHVMERESFDNPEIAALMNEHFVNIKVDREERPDVDRVYMYYVEASTGRGGWPMNVWLTPDLNPIFGGTYFPPFTRSGRLGLPDVITHIAKLWEENREEIEDRSANDLNLLEQWLRQPTSGDLPAHTELLEKTYERISSSFDPQSGGFGPAPKFPRTSILTFLFHYYAWKGADHSEGKRALEMAILTLRKMAHGGIQDHLGGGFHRYSVDAQWHVPHFEKMLYDQAQLANAYLDAYQITRDELFADTVRSILQYVNRDLSHPDGGFYSAEDADSIAADGSGEEKEGAFYIWRREEIKGYLDPKEAEILSGHLGVEAIGNVAHESDPQGEFMGWNVLKVSQSIETVAERAQLSSEEATALFHLARDKLLEARGGRPRPFRDDKIITAWNGLMISAFARASRILRQPDYLRSAERAASFIEANLYLPEDDTLLRIFRNGPGSIRGFCQDYAYLIQGLLDFYESSLDFRWLQLAIKLQRSQDRQFHDPEGGGYFSDSGRDSSILIRLKEPFDGSEPAPNSVSALNLFRLAEMTGISSFRNAGQEILQTFSTTLADSPISMPLLVTAIDFLRAKSKQIILAGNAHDERTVQMLEEIFRHYLPNKIVLLADGGAGQEFLMRNLKAFEAIEPIGGLTTAYVCEDYLCKLPTSDLAVLADLLAQQ